MESFFGLSSRDKQQIQSDISKHCYKPNVDSECRYKIVVTNAHIVSTFLFITRNRRLDELVNERLEINTHSIQYTTVYITTKVHHDHFGLRWKINHESRIHVFVISQHEWCCTIKYGVYILVWCYHIADLGHLLFLLTRLATHISLSSLKLWLRSDLKKSDTRW